MAYTVDVMSSSCECKAGRLGGFCKHMAALYRFFEVECIRMPPVLMRHRKEIVVIALGKEEAKKLPKHFWLPWRKQPNQAAALLEEEGEAQQLDCQMDENETLSSDNQTAIGPAARPLQSHFVNVSDQQEHIKSTRHTCTLGTLKLYLQCNHYYYNTSNKPPSLSNKLLPSNNTP